MSERIDRRRMVSRSAMGAAALFAGRPVPAQAQTAPDGSGWIITLNTSTIRPSSLDEKIRAASEGGYEGIELWSNEISEYAQSGGSPEALGKRLADLGLVVPNVIGLWNWMPESDDERPETLNRVRRQMEEAAQVGALHIAAVPTPDRPDIDLVWAAERYRELLELGEGIGIIPAIEFVGFLQGVNRLGEASAIAIEADHPQACLVADTFHLYRGGTGFRGVTHLAPSFFASFHFNDVPAEPGQFELKDADRIYPGDGILPLPKLLADLRAVGFHGPLSLEMFNRDHWQQDPVEVAKTGMAKIRRVIAQSEVLG
jgi:2-keto-myo-inositol isomerase